MKRIISTLCLLSLPVCIAFAEDTDDGVVLPGDNGEDAEDPGTGKINDNRKRSPSRHIVYFNYDSQLAIVSIGMPGNIDSLTITISYDDGSTYYGYITRECPCWNVKLPTGLAHIVCTSGSGQVFKGDIIID